MGGSRACVGWGRATTVSNHCRFFVGPPRIHCRFFCGGLSRTVADFFRRPLRSIAESCWRWECDEKHSKQGADFFCRFFFLPEHCKLSLKMNIKKSAKKSAPCLGGLPERKKEIIRPRSNQDPARIQPGSNQNPTKEIRETWMDCKIII